MDAWNAWLDYISAINGWPRWESELSKIGGPPPIHVVSRRFKNSRRLSCHLPHFRIIDFISVKLILPWEREGKSAGFQRHSNFHVDACRSTLLPCCYPNRNSSASFEKLPLCTGVGREGDVSRGCFRGEFGVVTEISRTRFSNKTRRLRYKFEIYLVYGK